jgi:hypothetical protein
MKSKGCSGSCGIDIWRCSPAAFRPPAVGSASVFREGLCGAVIQTSFHSHDKIYSCEQDYYAITKRSIAMSDVFLTLNVHVSNVYVLIFFFSAGLVLRNR